MTRHTIVVAASRLQGLGTSFKAFIRLDLKSNAAITLSLLQKYSRNAMQNAPEAQPDEGVTSQTPIPNTAYSSFPCVVTETGNYPSFW